jgi:hypothetical protein
MTTRSPQGRAVIAAGAWSAWLLAWILGGVTPLEAADLPKESSASTADPWACAPCHQTAGWSRLADKVAFDHGQTGTPLSGAHLRAPCSGCHRPAERSQAKLPKACADCHRDPHRDELGDRCTDCHSATNWLAPRSLPSHETTRFPLTGAHTATDCRACHTRLGGTVYRGTPTVCADCHLSTALAVKKPDHRSPGFGPGCQTCHGTFAWGPAKVNHSVWWPLDGKHALQSCDTCHSVAVFKGKNGACVGCHGDLVASAHPDHKQLGFSNSCENCHTALGWHVMRSNWHDGFYRISSGDHAGIGCGGCHGGGYDKARLVCTSCHEHNKASMDKEHGGVGNYSWNSGACYDCHGNSKDD